MMKLEHTEVRTNGIRLHVVQSGPPNGPLVILLHGFPEFWYGWRHQISVLAEAGYRVWAPDQRGYNLSDKPPGITAYNLDELAKDVIGLIDAAGQEQAYLVGHDWGAAVTWWTALKYPQRLNKIAVLNVPHPRVMKRMLRSSWAQLRKSWYIFFFQLPWLPEAFTRANNWQNGVAALRGSSRPNVFTDADLVFYRAAWSQPGAITGMINWYRALLRSQPKSVASSQVKVPTLLIWGARDLFLGREMAQPSIDLCDQGQLVLLEEATHWVQHEEAAHVNRLLLEFFNQ